MHSSSSDGARRRPDPGPRGKTRRVWPLLAAFALAAAIALASCASSTNDATETLSADALLDPARCVPCHADQFREWSGSMHAYAAEDPVFRAMNKRMQRETNGQAGTLCVGCHAPLAVRLGMTQDGLNLDSIKSSLRGVTCFFCHSTDAVEGSHQNPLRLASDGVLRGALHAPAPIKAPHRVAYSPLHDRDDLRSASTCGACHDVVTAHGAHLERTFEEWQASLYSKPGQLTCGKCHMPGRLGLAANVPGAPTRTVHDHSMASVDVALTAFPELDAQRAAVQRMLDNTLLAKLCVGRTPEAGLVAEVTLDNAFAGHKFPSGASQDRRAWVELVAYRGAEQVFTTGDIPDGVAASAVHDPNLWLLGDKIVRPDGAETHMFWEAASVVASQLPAATTADPTDPSFVHSVAKTFPLPSPAPDRVTLRVRMRPVDFDVLDDLAKSGDLDPNLRQRIPTFDLASTRKEWTSALGVRCVE